MRYWSAKPQVWHTQTTASHTARERRENTRRCAKLRFGTPLSY
jgi:hypothetical protein